MFYLFSMYMWNVCVGVKEHSLEVNSLSSSTYMSLRNSAQVLRLGNKGLQLLSNLVSIQFEKDLFTYLLCVPVQVGVHRSQKRVSAVFLYFHLFL